MTWDGASILITGGAGSLGSAVVRLLLALDTPPRRVIVFSRDEGKHHDLREAMAGDPRLRFMVGDVRDRERLRWALRGVDFVIHAAALKQAPSCEYNPMEAVSTNIIGSENVALAAIEQGVARAILVSSDKAVAPVLTYGATKLAAERVFLQANTYVGRDQRTELGATRYGNVIGSRGSVVPLWREQIARGRPITMSDPDATRFLITMPQAVAFVLRALASQPGGEMWIPKLPAATVGVMAEAVAPGVDRVVIGLREGEKKHEVLLSADEASRAQDVGGCYCLLPPWRTRGTAPPLPEGFCYASNAAEMLDVRGVVALLLPERHADLPAP